jgi:kynureninase
VSFEPRPPDSRSAAIALDAADPLAFARERFDLPPGLIYLDGNSLGAKTSSVSLDDAVNRQWGRDLITSWNANAWWTLPRRIGDRIGALVGAASGQVMCGDSTTVQLFQALTAAARLRPERRVLITDGANFPTDQYVADSVGRLLGLDVQRTSPIDPLPEDVGVVAFSTVDYRTGERWNDEAITDAAHEAGAVIVWDVSHAVGALPVELDRIGADLAVGCSYKYLNGGPGAPAWIYVAARHQPWVDLPLTGWHGHVDPFGLTSTYTPAAGIERARIGTPPVLSMLALEGALEIWRDVSLADVRAKSLALTDLAIARADAAGLETVTPRGHDRRGSQVALRLSRAYEVCQALIRRGIIGDFRAPDLLRLGFAPLYLRHTDVWDAMDELVHLVETESLAAAPRPEGVVT